MQNKSKRRWLDIQIVIASIAVSLTVGLWNVFARGSSPAPVPTATPPEASDHAFTYVPSPTATARLDPNAPVKLPKVHILMGGGMPSAPIVVAGMPPSGDGGSGGGGGGPKNPPPGNPPPAKPVPPPATGSSKK